MYVCMHACKCMPVDIALAFHFVQVKSLWLCAVLRAKLAVWKASRNAPAASPISSSGFIDVGHHA